MGNKKDIKSINWNLIARLLFDRDNKNEASGLIEENELSVSDQNELEESRSISKKIDLYYSQKKYSEVAAWNRVKQRIYNDKKRNFYATTLFKVAAVVVFAIIVGTASFIFLQKENAIAKHQLVSGSDPITNFELPDGTIVSLNSDSKIVFPEMFDDDTREVSIEGEAFFNVRPNPTKPFIISAGKAQIKVLGTSFNVNAYPGTDKVEVIVETGKVQVSRKETNPSKTDELILIPGDKGILSCSTSILSKSKNEDLNFLAWKTHNLIFRETSLNEVILTLKKVYKVEIGFADKNLGNLLLTGQYNNYSIEFILEVISSTLQLEVERPDGNFLLKAHS